MKRSTKLNFMAQTIAKAGPKKGGRRTASRQKISTPALKTFRIIERVLWTALSLLILVMILTGAMNTLLGFVAKHEGLRDGVAKVFGDNWWSQLNPLNELQWYFFSIVFLIGGAFLIRQDGHVRVDVLYERLRRKRQRAINSIGTLLLLLPWSGLLFYLSLKPVYKDVVIRRTSDSTWMPHYLIQLFIPIGFALLFLTALWELIKLFRGKPSYMDAAEHGHPETEAA